MATRGSSVAKPRYLVVRNLRDSHVGFTHSDKKMDVVIEPFGSVALNPEDWEDEPNLNLLVEGNYVSVSGSERKPRRPERAPAIFDNLRTPDKEAALNIAFAGDEVAFDLIAMEPERSAPRAGSQSPMVDVEYLKVRHLPVLQAALWLLKHAEVQKEDRIRAVEDRIAAIQEMRD